MGNLRNERPYTIRFVYDSKDSVENQDVQPTS